MLRNQTRRVSPADQALMNLRQLEMTPFLSAPSRMVLTEARFHMQGIASRTARLRRWL